MDDAHERASSPETVTYGELPELTRGLRALGSARGAGNSQQAQFFRPLLEARRRAADARTPVARIAAFDTTELNKALYKMLDRLVTDWPDAREPVRRALRAELRERARPYAAALDVLQARARDAASADEAGRDERWRAWTVQLAATFVAADRTWVALSTVAEAVRK